MKRLYFAGLLLVTVASATSTNAQNLAIDWSSIDGGGGASTGGVYSVSGTIGQPDAGVSSGGQFTLAGGFWGVSLADAPRLRITLSGSNVILAWPDPSTGFVLQQAGVLPAVPASWSNVGQAPTVMNGEKQVTLAHSLSARFYRLSKP